MTPQVEAPLCSQSSHGVGVAMTDKGHSRTEDAPGVKEAFPGLGFNDLSIGEQSHFDEARGAPSVVTGIYFHRKTVHRKATRVFDFMEPYADRENALYDSDDPPYRCEGCGKTLKKKTRTASGTT